LTDEEPDLVHVRGDGDARTAVALLDADQVAERVHPYLIHKWLQMGDDDIPHAVFP
jgi:hypothetical protein